MVRTFSCIVFAWIIFRAENTGHAWQFIYDMLTGLASKKGYIEAFNTLYWTGPVIHIILFLFVLIEWLGRDGQYAISEFGLKWRRPYRYGFYYALILLIYWYGGKEQQFIYFQF
jgi:hypothetical protein